MEYEENPLSPKSKLLPTRPLKFWKDNRHRFPYLSMIARDIFGIPASSGSIERVFSTAIDVLSIKRCNMKVDLFNFNVFIKRNKMMKD